MIHTLVRQLRFTRGKWVSAFDGVPAEDGERRLGQSNSLSWMVAHLAAHEQRTWVELAQGRVIDAAVYACAPGQPATVPPYVATWEIWREVVAAADVYLDTITDAVTRSTLPDGRETVGTMLLRNIYHYWYHLGEVQMIRQQMGHGDLPGFVGRMPDDLW